MQHLTVPAERARDRLIRTTGQEVLFLLALAFILGFGWWWYEVWALLLTPPAVLTPQGIFTVMISAVYALVVPLFISMLLPNSPAGWLLQQQTWAYPGQLAVMVATLVLGFFGGSAMWYWLSSQGAGVVETGMFYPAFFAALVGAFLVPGLQFAYMTPTQQLVRIQQAHEIKKLRILHGGEVAVLEARLQWLKQKAALSASELLPADQAQVQETLRGLFKSIGDSQRRIALSVGVSREVMATMGLLADDQIDQALEEVERVIQRPARHLEMALPEPEPVFADKPSVVEAQSATHNDSRWQSEKSPAPASVTDGQRLSASDSVARRIARDLPRVFTAQNLADLLQQDKRTAQRTIATWLSDGLIEQVQLGRYSLTEREVA